MRRLALYLICLCSIAVAGCAERLVIPRSLEEQVDTAITFTQLRDQPAHHRGRLVLLGGLVLKADRLKDRTQLEILQLPLDSLHLPRAPLVTTEGRFLAYQKPFLDPATFSEGTRVTLVGEVTGSAVQDLGGTEYSYPTIEIKYLKLWEVVQPYSWPGRRPWGRPWSGSSLSEPVHGGRMF
jgi:outer membrane lipoprotein